MCRGRDMIRAKIDFARYVGAWLLPLKRELKMLCKSAYRSFIQMVINFAKERKVGLGPMHGSKYWSFLFFLCPPTLLGYRFLCTFWPLDTVTSKMHRKGCTSNTRILFFSLTLQINRSLKGNNKQTIPGYGLGVGHTLR